MAMFVSLPVFFWIRYCSSVSCLLVGGVSVVNLMMYLPGSPPGRVVFISSVLYFGLRLLVSPSDSFIGCPVAGSIRSSQATGCVQWLSKV